MVLASEDQGRDPLLFAPIEPGADQFIAAVADPADPRCEAQPLAEPGRQRGSVAAGDLGEMAGQQRAVVEVGDFAEIVAAMLAEVLAA